MMESPEVLVLLIRILIVCLGVLFIAKLPWRW